MARGWRQGLYKIKHPEKYIGDANNVVYRSSWELKMNEFLDNNPNILEWNSEELIIPYVKPTDGRVHRYFPDYWVKYKNRRGEIIQEVLEVKPASQVNKPKRTGKRRKQQLYEEITHAINSAKWKAAVQFCNKYGMKFKLITENELFK